MINDIGNEVVNYKELRYIPQTDVRNFRNDMYLVSEAIRLMQKSQPFNLCHRSQDAGQLQKAR